MQRLTTPTSYRSLRSRTITKMSLYVGLDCGTQSTKCLVYDEKKRAVISRGSSPHTLIQTRPGQAEQHPSIWLEACKEAIHQALEGCTKEEISRIKALSVSGQQHGLVVLDQEKNVIRPSKLWCDVESADEAEELSQKFGFTLVPSFTVTKLLWLKNNEPENFARVAHVLLPHDFINFYLTGKMVMEASDASGIGLFDARTKTWDAERMEQFDASESNIAGYFPPVIGANEIVGSVRSEIAAEWGLPEGVLVGPGGGDNACSAMGSGAVEEGTWVVSLGTSGTLFGVAGKPILDPTCTICPFCDATGRWLPLLCTLNCTGVVEEVKNAFGLGHQQLTELAAKEQPGCEEVTFLPYLAGERTPNWPHATGALLGLRAGLLRPGLVYRAAIEGATFSLLAGLRRMQDYGLSATKLLVVGGGSKNPLWRRIMSDAFQLELAFPAEPESAALGAALQAGALANQIPIESYVLQHRPPLEAEVIVPDATVAGHYKAAFERYIKIGNDMFGGTTCTV